MRNHHLITSTIYWGYLCSEHVEVKKVRQLPAILRTPLVLVIDGRHFSAILHSPLEFANYTGRCLGVFGCWLIDSLLSRIISTRVDTRHARSHFIAIEPFKCGDDFVPSTFAHAGAGSELLDRRRTFHTPLPCRLCDAQILTGLVQKKRLARYESYADNALPKEEYQNTEIYHSFKSQYEHFVR